jgi:hypothetical protein
MARLKSNKNNFSVHAWSPLVVAMLHQHVQFNNVVLPAPKKLHSMDDWVPSRMKRNAKNMI